MSYVPLKLLFLFVLIIPSSLPFSQPKDGPKKRHLTYLTDKLLKSYDPTIRPVMDESQVLLLTITPNQLNVLNLDQAEETVIFSAEFILEWQDAFLLWDPEDNNNLTWIKLKEAQVWRPDVIVSSSIERTTLLEEHDRYLDIRYDGLVRQSMFGVFTNLCNMKVDRFPYDSQVCLVTIEPWSYTSDEILCVVGPIAAADDEFSGNSEWEFKNITSELATSYDTDVGFEYSMVHTYIIIKRKPLFYVWVLLIPTFIITTICICGLFIPTNNLGDREERVNIGLTTLLSSAVILQIVADSMPKTSALPLLGNFILAEIFVVAIGVLCSVLVLLLHNRSFTREWTPPSYILWILIKTGSGKFVKENRELMHPIVITPEITFTGENEKLLNQLSSGLKSVCDFMEDVVRDRIRALAWLKFFDRLDFCLMVFFLVGNSLVTYFVCTSG